MRTHIIREKHGVRVPGRFELSWGRWSLALSVIYGHGDEDRWPWMLRIHFLLINLFLHFPCRIIPKSKLEPYMRDWQHWGFCFGDCSIHFHWNEHVKVWDWPWAARQSRHEVLRPDGTWVPFIGSWEKDKEPDGREVNVYPYRYTLKNGEIQDRRATVFVERRAWRPRWFMWTSLFEKERRAIEVEFSGEVGERTGSWKGGCIGCGYTMIPGESQEQTLRRMEQERIFA